MALIMQVPDLKTIDRGQFPATGLPRNK